MLSGESYIWRCPSGLRSSSWPKSFSTSSWEMMNSQDSGTCFQTQQRSLVVNSNVRQREGKMSRTLDVSSSCSADRTMQTRAWVLSSSRPWVFWPAPTTFNRRHWWAPWPLSPGTPAWSRNLVAPLLDQSSVRVVNQEDNLGFSQHGTETQFTWFHLSSPLLISGDIIVIRYQFGCCWRFFRSFRTRSRTSLDDCWTHSNLTPPPSACVDSQGSSAANLLRRCAAHTTGKSAAGRSCDPVQTLCWAESGVSQSVLRDGDMRESRYSCAGRKNTSAKEKPSSLHTKVLLEEQQF